MDKRESDGPSLSALFFLSVREDIVPQAFIASLRIIHERVVVLFYEDLGILWDFSFYRGEFTFFYLNQRWIPTAIYQRHPGVKEDQEGYEKQLAFLEAIEHWDGVVVGQLRRHRYNFSKGYQFIASLSKACHEIDKVKLPYTCYIKGTLSQLKAKNLSLVVKSASSFRSKVAGEEEFQTWDVESLRLLPTLFQQRIDGVDLRVHLFEELFWGLLVKGKDCIDYRYSPKGSIEYEERDLDQEVKKFCKQVAQTEENRFVGIDFVVKDGTYYCLEVNPSPGWSTYQHPSREVFAKEVFFRLNKKIY